MRIVYITILTLFATDLCGQAGYVRLSNDSLLSGFLRQYISTADGQRCIEVWKTKTDKKPRRIPKTAIAEYAIKKDTFKVLHQFKPFEKTNTYFELIDAKLESRGKVNLYIIENYATPQRVSTYTIGGIIPAIIDESLGNYTYMYILEEIETGYLKALSSKQKDLKTTLMEFFPEKYVTKYDQVKGEIT